MKRKKQGKREIIVYCKFRADGVLLGYVKYIPANDYTEPRYAWEYPDGSVRIY
jgi:hypothetical protein